MNTPFTQAVDEALGRVRNRDLLIGLGVVFGLILFATLLAPHIHGFRFLGVATLIACLALGCSCFALISTGIFPSRTERLRVIGIGSLLLAIVAWVSSPAQANEHPLFKTPLTGRVGSRPAIQVDVLDDSEGPIGGTAELYLTVQSSRFPESVRIVFPVNRGDFIGCGSRFIQLPFEVEDGDLLLFNLLDEDGLSPDEEKLLLGACHTAGYCLALGSALYQPHLGPLVHPAFMSAAEVIGNGAVLHYRENSFENYGVGEYIIESSRPRAPNMANRVTLVQAPNHARAHVRVYFPSHAME